MDFNAFDTQKIKEYAERAKKEWGETTEYQEFEAKNARRTQKESGSINEQLMGLVAAFGTLQTREPADPAVQAQVKKLRDFITETNRTLPLYKRMSAVEFSAQPLPRNAMGKLMR